VRKLFHIVDLPFSSLEGRPLAVFLQLDSYTAIEGKMTPPNIDEYTFSANITVSSRLDTSIGRNKRPEESPGLFPATAALIFLNSTLGGGPK
jgi:hypothetical protein